MRFLGIKISQALYDQLREQSLKQGINLSAYVRSLLEQGIIDEQHDRVSDDVQSTLRLLDRVGCVSSEALILSRCCLKEMLGAARNAEFENLAKLAHNEARDVMGRFCAEAKQ